MTARESEISADHATQESDAISLFAIAKVRAHRLVVSLTRPDHAHTLSEVQP